MGRAQITMKRRTRPGKIEPQFRRLAEALPHMVWTCTAEGPCDYLSPQWLAYTGLPEREQLGYGWLERLHPEDVERTKARWNAAVAQGGPFDTEFRIRRHDGQYRWFKTRAVPERDRSGRVLKWFGSNTDIQELRDAQEATAALNRQLEEGVEQRTQELRAANRRLETLMKQLQTAQRLTSVGSWEFDLATGEATWSDELFRIFGMESAAAAPNASRHAMLFDEESWARLSSALEHSRTTGEGYELVLTAVRRDGSHRTTVARAETLRNAAGKVEQLVGTFQDITVREQIARELKQLSDRLQLATSAAKIGVWEWNVVSNGIVWDETMWQLYQLPRIEPMTYERFRAALHPDDLEGFERELNTALSRGSDFASTMRIVRPDGAVRHLQVAATFERDPSGRAVRMTGVNWDITEQHVAELALQQSEALQRAILAHAGPAVIATTPSGVISLFNRAAEELLGYRADEVVGQVTPWIFHDSEEIAARRAVLEQERGAHLGHAFEVFMRGTREHAAEPYEWTYLRKDGTRVPVLLTVSAVRNNASAVVGYLGVAFDLTQRKAQERELIELNRLLGQRTRQMEVLLQEVHHRVKNNLQVIASLVNMQARQVGDQAARAALADCRTRVLAIALIHEQLYQSSDYSRVPFSGYARQLARNVFAASASSAHVKLVNDMESVALPVEQAIPCGLILNELMTNALKHAFPNERRGTLNVGLHLTSEGELTLSVADDGVGIPSELSMDFGHGLGMQLVFDLAQQLDGRVEITGTHGTRVSVSFSYPSQEPGQ